MLKLTVGLSRFIIKKVEAPDDSEEIRLQKTILIGSSFMVVTATIIWGLAYIYFREPLAGAISLSYSVVTLISLMQLFATHRHRFYMGLQLWMGLLLPFIQMLVLGGFANSGGVILWSVISPLGISLLYENPRLGRWWLAFIILLFIAGLAEPFLRPTNNLPGALINGLFILNIAAVSTIALVTIRYFIDRKNKTLIQLRLEEQKSENLLLNILPIEIAAILRNENRIIADHYDSVSILFADIVGFTSLTARMAPVDLIKLLDEVFSYFDSLVEKYDVEKIRTMGDSYMVAAGVPRQCPNHAHALALMALDMRDYIQKRSATGLHPLVLRIGINSGPVVGGVIGRKKFVFDLWGDVVNIASRMESQGIPGAIQVTAATYELLKERFVLKPRGSIAVKGKGEMPTWLLAGTK
jgi:adenylate cyclase